MPAPPVSTVAVAGAGARFGVGRIFCVGRNYAEHAREMGGDPRREPPFFFMKPATAILEDGTPLPYPPRTQNLHHEVELVIAIGRGGTGIRAERALDHVYGYAVGNDFTRRDLQTDMRSSGRPWEIAKAFDGSAGVGAIHPVARIGHPARAAIWLAVNGVERQRGDIADMIWSPAGILAELSTLFRLEPGDLVYTGTPSGVGALRPGDTVVAGVDGLGVLTNTINPPTVA